MNQNEFGIEFLLGDVMIFFGTRDSQIRNLVHHYSKFQFKRLKQVHGDKIVQINGDSPDYQIEADASWTTEQGLALCIVTADCLPIFLFDESKQAIGGVHSGWRGVAQNLAVKTVQTMQPSPTHAFIGPHIHQDNFEIQHDTLDLLLKSSPHPEDNQQFYRKQNNRYLFDLDHLTRMQLQHAGLKDENIFSMHINTYTDKQFHSYRRDKDQSGRQISFIVKL